MFNWRKLTAVLCVMVPALLFGGGKQGGDYPNGPITFIVPYKAGGGTDSTARLVQKALKDSKAVDVPVVVQNVDGGGGLIGMREALKARPDGKTFLFVPKSILTGPPYSKADFSYRDFKAVAQFGETPYTYMVREDSPYHSLAELVKAGKMNLRNSPGTTIDVINAMLVEATGDKSLNMVNAGSGAASLQLLLGGQLDAGPFSLIEYTQFRQQGTRGIAVLSTERLPDFPELVPAKEQGIDLVFSQVHYLLAPSETPDSIVSFVSSALERALALPATKEAFKKQGLETAFHGQESAAEQLAKEGARIEDIVKNVLLTRE